MDPQTLKRTAVGAAAIVLIALLALKVASRLLEPDELAEPGAELVVEPASPDAGVRIRAHEPVRVHVQVDGETSFRGTLCNGQGDHGCGFDVPAAKEIAVELSDLTRAQVSYNGRRIEPLGNLSAPRRLVFVDDAD